MTKDCDFALMLWNGKSYGTFDDIWEEAMKIRGMYTH